jgi:hypothetical protein
MYPTTPTAITIDSAIADVTRDERDLTRGV